MYFKVLSNVVLCVILFRLIASGRLIEFGSINRLESWRFESIQLESLGESIPKVGIETRLEKPTRIAKTTIFSKFNYF